MSGRRSIHDEEVYHRSLRQQARVATTKLVVLNFLFRCLVLATHGFSFYSLFLLGLAVGKDCDLLMRYIELVESLCQLLGDLSCFVKLLLLFLLLRLVCLEGSGLVTLEASRVRRRVEIFTATAEQTEVPRIGKLACYSSYSGFRNEELVPAPALVISIQNHRLFSARMSAMATKKIDYEDLLVGVVPDEVVDDCGGVADFLVGGIPEVEFVIYSQGLRCHFKLLEIIIEIDVGHRLHGLASLHLECAVIRLGRTDE